MIKHRALPRYAFLDPYTLEELRRRFSDPDATNRIALLAEIAATTETGLPFEVADWACADSDPLVRQWLARNWKRLDYNKYGEARKSELDLHARLAGDPDPMVRAALRENPNAYDSIFDSHWQTWFREATQLERLALVRNPSPGLPEKLIESIFDCRDTELGISLPERVELVRAFLSNAAILDLPRDRARWARLDWTEHQFGRLWKLASEWPIEVVPVGLVYQCLPADDNSKAEVFANCKSAVLRAKILEDRCSVNDRRTLELAIKDEDDEVRAGAWAMATMSADQIAQAIDGADRAAHWGLAHNPTVPTEALKRLEKRCIDLGDEEFGRNCRVAARDEISARWDKETELKDQKDPQRLFSGKLRNDGEKINQKLNLIGTKLFAMDRERRQRREAFWRVWNRVFTQVVFTATTVFVLGEAVREVLVGSLLWAVLLVALGVFVAMVAWESWKERVSERAQARVAWLLRILGPWSLAGALSVWCVASVGEASTWAVIVLGLGAVVSGIGARALTRRATFNRIERVLEWRENIAVPQSRKQVPDNRVWFSVWVASWLLFVGFFVILPPIGHRYFPWWPWWPTKLSAKDLCWISLCFFALAGLPHWFDWGAE